MVDIIDGEMAVRRLENATAAFEKTISTNDDLVSVPNVGDVPSMKKRIDDAIGADAFTQVFRNVKDWSQGEVVTSPYQRYYFPNQSQGEKSYTWFAPLASTSNPITLGASPINDDNWQQWDVSSEDLTQSQEEIIGEIYKGESGVHIKNGDSIPPKNPPIKYVSAVRDGEVRIFEIFPAISGQISDLDNDGGQIDGNRFYFLSTSKKQDYFHFNDTSKADVNTGIITSAINSGKEVEINNHTYFTPKSSLVEKDVVMKCKNGAEMRFIGSGVMFKLKDNLSLSNEGFNYVVGDGAYVKYFDYELPDGKLRSVSIEKFSVKGNLQLVNPTSGLDLDPTVAVFGIDYINIEDGKTEGLEKQLCVMNSTPYVDMVVKNVHGKNNKQMTVSCPVQNSHPYYSKIQSSMQSLTVDNVTQENERGFFAETADSSYAGIVLWEGKKASVKNTRCEGVVTKNGTPVYDFYMAGIDAITEGCVMKDSYAFNYDGNTPLKIKKVENCDAVRKRATFSKDFFDYWETNHGLSLSNSGGNPWTIDLESIGGDYSINSCYLVCPYVPSNGRQKAPQNMSSLSIHGTKVFVKSGVAPYLAAMKWSDSTKDGNKFLSVKDSEFVIDTTDPFYLAKMEINKGTADGGFIDMSGNTIRAKGGVYELLITTEDTDNKDTILDYLKIGNAVYTDGKYQQIKNFCKLPTVKNTDYSGSSLQMNTTGNEIFFGSNAMGNGASSGSYRHVQKGQPDKVYAVAFHRPQSSKVSAGKVLISGHVKYDNEIRNFNTYMDVNPNESANTIDITVPVLAGGVQTYTWSGAVGNIVYLDIGHGIDEPFVLLLRRFDDYFGLSFEFRSGMEPSYIDLNWEYSSI